MKATWTLGLVCLMAIVPLVAGGCKEAVLKAKGAKGYWAFDGSGATVVNGIGTNHGQVQGDLARTEGKDGQAVAFDGKGYVRIDTAPYLSAPAYTFAAWVNLSNTGDYQYIVWRGGPDFPEMTQCRNLDIWVTMEGTLAGLLDYKNDAEPRLHLVGAATVADGKWHHVALVNDGKTATFYVDGKQDGQDTLAGPLADNDFPLWIGARPGDVAATGVIDEVIFFDRALTPDEVAAMP